MDQLSRPADGDNRVEVRVLGWIGAIADGRRVDVGGPRQQALLAALATRPGRVLSNDALIEAVWDGDPPDRATRTFRTYVARLRRAFDEAGVEGTEVVQTDSAGYRLASEVTVDADRFESEVARSRRHFDDGEFTECVRLTAVALGRWDGPAYGRHAARAWATPAAVGLEELRVSATVLRARALLAVDRAAPAVELLESLAAREPLREEVARLHAVALYRSGRDAAAIRVVRDFRDRLVEGHGLDPSPELATLESLLLNRDPRLDRPLHGRRVRGYVLHEPIARTPLGTVHRAEQPSIGREVAVTVLPATVADDPDVVRAFETRLQAIASLHHAHVLPVYDYWREPGGAYVVTRLHARTLEGALAGGGSSAVDALALGEQVADAVAAAHEHDIVHGAIGLRAVALDQHGDAYLWAFPPTETAHRPASDVAALADLVETVAAASDRPTGHGVATDLFPQQLQAVLARARAPNGGPVVTAAELAAAIAAARAGTAEPATATPGTGPNPYRGLSAFRETDQEVFFGREALAKQLLVRLERLRAVSVVGPSGSGKSSLVRAGLLPRLRDEGAFVTTMVPGSNPLDELEVALTRIASVELDHAVDDVLADPDGLSRLVARVVPDPGATVVLVVDQFEELFTLSGTTERELFLRALAGAVDAPHTPVRVVVTLRADLLDAALTHPVARGLVRDRTVMVAPLDDEELRAAIVEPAAVAGVSVDQALVTALVADATRAPGSLPMVQFALTEVFAAADDGRMGLDAYRRIGGVQGVLGQRAEEVFADLDEDEQRAAHRLFQRLVTPQRDGLPTRRRALRTELDGVPEHVIETFGQARLLTFDHEAGSREPTVEVSHEALFAAWPRLAAWIEEGEDDLRLLRHLARTARDWDASRRDQAELYRGSRLDSALGFASAQPGALSPTERAFLEASEQRRSREQLRSQRTLRRFRMLTAGLAVGLLTTLVAGLVALEQRRDAQTAQRVAVARELAASSLAVRDEDPELGILLALEAVARTGTDSEGVLPEVEDALHRAVISSRLVTTVPGLGGSVAWHPGGDLFVTEGPEESGLVDIRDVTSGASVRSFAGHDSDINDVAFSDDGTLLATTGDDGSLRVWDVDTTDLVAQVGGQGVVWGVSFSPDGTTVAAAWADEAVVRVLDVSGDDPPLEVFAQTAGMRDSTAFSPDGRGLAIAGRTGAVVVDPATGDRLRRFDESTFLSAGVAWSPDGRWIAVNEAAASTRIVDTSTGEIHAEVASDARFAIDLDWSPDSSRLAIGSQDGTTRVLEITEDGAVERISLTARDDAVGGVAFSPDGERLLTGDTSVANARIWNVGTSGGSEWVNLPTTTEVAASAAFTPDGTRVVLSGEDHAAVVWDVASGTAGVHVGTDFLPASQVAVSPDGSTVATKSGQYASRVHLWDLSTGRETARVETAGLGAARVAWSPGSDLVAIAGDDGRASGRVAIVDRAGALVTALSDGQNYSTEDVAFTPDGQRVVVARRTVDRFVPTIDGIQVWDWSRGEVLVEIPVVPDAIAVDPTGTRIAAAQRSTVSVWDAVSGERLTDLDGHSGDVFDVAFSPDGASIATAGADATARLWETASGVERLVLRGGDGPVWSVDFSPDGARLVTTEPGLARVWALDIDDLVRIAASKLTRSLTDDECREHLHVERCPD